MSIEIISLEGIITLTGPMTINVGGKTLTNLLYQDGIHKQKWYTNNKNGMNILRLFLRLFLIFLLLLTS